MCVFRFFFCSFVSDENNERKKLEYKQTMSFGASWAIFNFAWMWEKFNIVKQVFVTLTIATSTAQTTNTKTETKQKKEKKKEKSKITGADFKR